MLDRDLAQAFRTAAWAEAHPIDAKRIITRDAGVAEELVDDVYGPAGTRPRGRAWTPS